MSRNYSLAHSLPKDTAGVRFTAWVDADTSQLDFTLPKGIGASTIGSKILGHLAIGTHTHGSVIENGHPGVAMVGVYIEDITASPAASATNPGTAQLAGITQWGEMLAMPAPKLASLMTTSVNVIKNSSGLLFGINIAASGASAGDLIQIKDGSSAKMSYVITDGNFTFSEMFPGGVYYSASLIQDMGLTQGNASITVLYR